MIKQNKIGRHKTTISCQCPPDLKDMYQRIYPYTLSRFLIKCIKKATNSKQFFESVFFEEL